jgi:hypothetical protein
MLIKKKMVYRPSGGSTFTVWHASLSLNQDEAYSLVSAHLISRKDFWVFLDKRLKQVLTLIMVSRHTLEFSAIAHQVDGIA